MRVYRVYYKDKNGKKKQIKKWWIELRDHLQIARRFPAFTNKSQSELLGRQIERLVNYKVAGEQPDPQLSRWLEQIPPRLQDKFLRIGLLNSNRVAAGKSLTEHLKAFEETLVAKERTPKYIKESIAQLKRVFEGCRFYYWSDISASKVETYLKGLRDNGISYRRSNAYLKTAKMFCRWMTERSFASESPLQSLRTLNVELDRRRERRAGTPDELRRLLEVTANGPMRFGLSGSVRALVYKFAAETGLRKNELRTLKVSALDFENLTVTVETGYSKHRKKDVLPLKPEMVAELRNYCANKTPNTNLFALTDKTANMIQADLADTGIDYVDANDKVFDFHGLRHTFITNLRNAPSRVAQSLARHRSSAMTDRYTHIRLYDERAALKDLPDLSLPSREKQRAIATGTDGKNDLASYLAFQSGKHSTTLDGSGQLTFADGAKNRVIQRAREDSNLQPSDSKSATLSN